MKHSDVSVIRKFWVLMFLVFISSFAVAIDTDDHNPRTIVDIQSIELANGFIQLSWSPIPNATGYKIYSAEHPAPYNFGYWKPLARVTNTSYVLSKNTTGRGF